MLRPKKTNLIATALFLIALSCAAMAQSTAFSYQGKLNETTGPANGQYDLSFSLYNSSGSQVGSSIAKDNVQVTDGIFSVSLDFGAASFDGTPRFLGISVRPGASTGSYTTLSPQQQIASSPYAVRSLNATTADTATNATQLGGVNSSQFVQTADSRMTDAREPLPNSASYIQNRTSGVQPSSSFNISGNGLIGGNFTAASVDTATQYNVGGHRAFWSGGTSLFAGVGAGPADLNTPANSNTYVGSSTGTASSSGSSFNTFVGNQAGQANTNSQNTFVGYAAGLQNVSGFQNTFLGTRAGGNPTGAAILGGQNTLVGYHTGWNLGNSNNMTLIGNGADVGAVGLSNGTAIGNGAIVSQSSAVILGAIGARVGIGTSAPTHKLQIVDDFNRGLRVQNTIGGGTVASFGATGDFNIDSSFSAGGRLNIKEDGTMTVSGATNIIGQTVVSGCPSCWAGVVPDKFVVDGTERLTVLGSGGATALCRNSSNQISSCSSSLRYKTGIESYRPGLDLIMKLQPISFRWKADDMLDFGLGAETVAEAEPLLVTHNDSGEIEGVKYDRVAVVLVNAVKEQQAQIAKQQELIAQQQRQIDGLRSSVASLRKRRFGH